MEIIFVLTSLRPSNSWTVRLRKTCFVVEALRGPARMEQEGTPPQDAQKVRPARPQRVKGPQRTLWGTLRA